MKLELEDIQNVTEYCIDKKEIDPKVLKWILICLNDLNSSTLREAVTSYICGYNWINTKKGYDAFDDKTQSHIEIKPKLFTGKRTNGSGNFSDLTMARVEKYENIKFNIICSLFCNNKLMYVLEFPYKTISEVCRKKTYEKCVTKNQRSARCVMFNYRDYINSKDLKIRYINIKLIEQYDCLNKKFLKVLKDKVSS